MTLESILITAKIDAMEEHEVAIMDLPHAFLHAKNEIEVIMKMEVKLVEMIVCLEPRIYWKYITTEKMGNKSCMFSSTRNYMGYLRVLNCCMKSS